VTGDTAVTNLLQTATQGSDQWSKQDQPGWQECAGGRLWSHNWAEVNADAAGSRLPVDTSLHTVNTDAPGFDFWI